MDDKQKLDIAISLLRKVFKERTSLHKDHNVYYDLLTQEISIFLKSEAKGRSKNKYRQITLDEQIKRSTNE